MKGEERQDADKVNVGCLSHRPRQDLKHDALLTNTPEIDWVEIQTLISVEAIVICDPENLKTDFFLLRDGPILVMSDRALWQAGVRWLQSARGYKVHSWQLKSESEFYKEVSETLSWEQQFGYSQWNGSLDALNDGVAGWPLSGDERIVISIDNAERLTEWSGGKTKHIWNILQDAARLHLLFGVGLLVMVNTATDGEATRWAKAERVSKLTRKTFPGAQLAKDAE